MGTVSEETFLEMAVHSSRKMKETFNEKLAHGKISSLFCHYCQRKIYRNVRKASSFPPTRE
jgi:hypothetical protein